MLASRRLSAAKIPGLLLLGALSLASYGCSSSSNNTNKTPVSCAVKPSDCKPGTTCWITSSGGYTCQTAKAGAGQGTSCINIVGQPQCDEHLGCFPNQSGSAKGTCQPFCDNGCKDANQVCYQVGIKGGAQVPICGPLPKDGGSDSGPPPSDAGKDATSNSDAATDSGSDATSKSDAGSSDAAGG